MFQFNYCQLVWMCHNCTKNNKINRLYERCVLLIQNDKKFFFEELLEINSSVLKYIKYIVAFHQRS